MPFYFKFETKTVLKWAHGLFVPSFCPFLKTLRFQWCHNWPRVATPKLKSRLLIIDILTSDQISSTSHSGFKPAKIKPEVHQNEFAPANLTVKIGICKAKYTFGGFTHLPIKWKQHNHNIFYSFIKFEFLTWESMKNYWFLELASGGLLGNCSCWFLQLFASNSGTQGWL